MSNEAVMSRFAWCVLLAVVLNTIDVVSTIILTHRLGLVEINPIMQHALYWHPVAFASVKMTVVCAVCVLLNKRRKHSPESASYAIGVVVGMLFMVCVWQTWMLVWSVAK
jgi:uncharacterized membrane protein